MRLPPPTDYLRQVTPYLKLHLFAQPSDLLTVINHFHPGVTQQDITDWRTEYRITSELDDRLGMPVMEEERQAIVEQVERLDGANTPARSYRRYLDAFLRRPGFHRSRAIMCGTTAPAGADRLAWTLQEDMGLLAGSDQRDDSADSRRNTYLNTLLTPYPPAAGGQEQEQEPEQPALQPEQPTLQPDPPAMPDTATPAPAAVIGVGNGVKAVVQDDLQQVFIELCGHGGVTYTKQQVATAITRLGLVHDMLEGDQ